MTETTFVPTTYLSFDGKDDFVALPSMNVDWSQGVTIEAWVRFEKFNQFARIIDMSNGRASANIVLCCQPSAPHLIAQVYTGAGQPHIIKEGALELGAWAHLAMTVDASMVGRIYKNGKLVQSGHVRLPESGTRAHNWIGRSAWSDDGYFQGQMADVRVWRVARSEAELQRDMTRKLGGNESGLVAYLPMDEGMGDVARDRSPNGFHGTRQGATWVSAPVSPTGGGGADLQELAALKKRITDLEAKLEKCCDCADKLTEQGKKIDELTKASSAAAQKTAEQDKKLAELETKLTALADKAARCGDCEALITAQNQTIAALSARLDELAKKCAEKHTTTPPPPPPPEPDDLEKIEGIGPKIAEVLQAAGIRTYKQLAAAEVAELQKILKTAGGTKFARNDPSTWPKQAQLLVEGKKAELTALQDTLRAGRPKS